MPPHPVPAHTHTPRAGGEGEREAWLGRPTFGWEEAEQEGTSPPESQRDKRLWPMKPVQTGPSENRGESAGLLKLPRGDQTLLALH